MACQLLDRAGAKELVQSIENVLFDCDGVLWNASNAVPGSVETVKKLKQLGKRVFYVTNNSVKSRKQCVQKFLKLGYDVQEEEIACTSYLAAIYLKSINFKGKIYLIGGKGIASELDLHGFSYIGVGADPTGDVSSVFTELTFDPDVDCVIVGFDEHISYRKILKSAKYLQNKNCLFIGAEEDEILTSFKTFGFPAPGTGVFINAVKTVSRREPIILGKPNPNMFDMLNKVHGLDPAKTLMVGDRLNTDVAFAKNCGLKSMLVFSGFTVPEDLLEVQQSSKLEDQQSLPDYYAEYLGKLGEYVTS